MRMRVFKQRGFVFEERHCKGVTRWEVMRCVGEKVMVQIY